MILEKEEFDIKVFQKEFKDRFKNFCEKAPVILTPTFLPHSVVLKDSMKGDSKEFEFDYSRTVKQNIKIIKDWLIQHKYPILIDLQKEKKDLSVQEIENLSNNIDLDKIILEGKTIRHGYGYQIEKILINASRVIIRDLQEDVCYLYQLKIPSVLFLRKILEEKNAHKRWLFFEKSTFKLTKLKQVNEKNRVIK